MKHPMLDVIAHEDLTESELCELRRLFDSEYLDDFGEWDPVQPYGYAPHDVHAIACIEGRVVGHVGGDRRDVTPLSHVVCGDPAGGDHRAVAAKSDRVQVAGGDVEETTPGVDVALAMLAIAGGNDRPVVATGEGMPSPGGQ